MTTRRLRSTFLLLPSLLIAPLFCAAQPHKPATAASVKVEFSGPSGTFNLQWPDGTTIGPIASSIELVDGTRFSTTDFPNHKTEQRKASPPGVVAPGMREYIVRYYGKSGAPELRQHIYVDTSRPYVLVDLDAVSNQPLSSRKISPIVLAAGGSARFAVKTLPTVLFVPNDNDMWVHYNEPIDPAKDPDSYEVTAIFDNASRKGMVLGSVTHDLWRTGVLARELGNGSSGKVEVYGGATGQWTHDVDPHGIVTGTTIHSPLVMVGYFADWRRGMETYGDINAQIHPPLAWSGGVPFGWNSWSAYLEKIDKQKYLAVADFIHSQLEPRGFKNDGTTYVNLDGGWTRIKEADVIESAKHIRDQGQRAGIYYTPFSYWSDDFSKPVEGTDGKYTYADILLRDSKGNPLPKIDGAHPLDPTHPGTIARIDYELARFVAWGYDSVKLDFLNCGSLEGHHYDPAITTGVQAYAYGMQRIQDDLSPKKIGRPFFISLSIAPLFPAYGHSRRVSCDAFGRIEDTEYLLNAVSFGWWTNGTLYRFNDPDHTVISRDTDPYHGTSPPGSIQTLDEARSRVDASIITGTVLLDSDDLMDPRAQQRAEELLTNAAILDVARAGRSFQPVEGDSGTHASKLFTRSDPDGSTLVAVFNYDGSHPMEFKVDLARLGLDNSRVYRVTDLWTGTTHETQGTLDVSLSPAQSMILRLAGGTSPAP
jgi:alpha-galactosidase